MTSKLTFYLSKGRIDDALASIQGYATVVAANANEFNATKVLGMAMHVAKAKKVVVVKSYEGKKAKHEVSYFRLVFFRGTGSSGEMFGVIYQVKDRELFQTSKVNIGFEYFIVRPSLVGDWNGLTMITTAEPLLPTNNLFINEPFYPIKLPEHGFLAFTIRNVHLLVQQTAIVDRCSGLLCGGRYATGKCPCVTTSHGPRPSLCFTLSVCSRDGLGVMTDLLKDWGSTIQPFSSTLLTDKLISTDDLQTALRTGADNFIDIIDHVEAQLVSVTWTVTGWLKASSTAVSTTSDEVLTIRPKLHLVIVDNEAPITKWTSVPAPVPVHHVAVRLPAPLPLPVGRAPVQAVPLAAQAQPAAPRSPAH